jgi:hypothetical protein
MMMLQRKKRRQSAGAVRSMMREHEADAHAGSMRFARINGEMSSGRLK